MPVAGSYRSIDFALSNMSNSHIQKVAVLTQDNARSLNEHLSSSKWWDFGRKQGGMYVFTPTRTLDNTDWYRGTADSIAQNIEFIKDSHEPYVVIASGDCVYKMDYGEVLEAHIDKKADITVVCKEMPEDVNVERYGCVKTDSDGRITEFEEKPVQAKSNTISCGIYIIRRRQLVEMIEKAALENRYDFVKDTIQDYYNTNMDFLNPEIRKYFFRTFPDIYSKVDDLPPAKYNVGVRVKNCLIASGSIINGTIENSVIFKKAFIGNNCTIKNSIILNDVYIGDNSYIENCIVESHGTIRANSYCKGEDKVKVVVENNERYVI